MGHIQRNLEDGERIVYQTKLHWVIFFWPPVFFLAFFLASASGFDFLAQIFLWLAFLSAFVAVTTYVRSEFVVTNRRIFGKLAVGRAPEYPEVKLIEVRHVEFRPGMLGGLIAYGTVVVTDKEGATHKFSTVPARFYEHVQARDERARRVLE